MSYIEYFTKDLKNVPEHLRNATVAIMERFTIFGKCDGMYIANTIAYTDGTGDGAGHFRRNVINDVEQVAKNIQNAYSSNIRKEDIPELEDILRTGVLGPKAEDGIRSFMERVSAELETTEMSWRKNFCKAELSFAEKTLARIAGTRTKKEVLA